jgi:site-specific DNA-methyltransferase (adenine-specific)
VWVVGDQTVDCSETGNSFQQALGFMRAGWKLHDTMVYVKLNNAPYNHPRYNQVFEYMFVLSKLVNKDRINTFNPIMLPAKHGNKNDVRGRHLNAASSDTAAMDSRMKDTKTREYKLRSNIWSYETGKFHNTKDLIAHKHPAIFPDKLAEDHIISWSNEGDVVLDPFCGSGTTCSMAKKLGRHYIGIDKSEEYVYLSISRCR